MKIGLERDASDKDREWNLVVVTVALFEEAEGAAIDRVGGAHGRAGIGGGSFFETTGTGAARKGKKRVLKGGFWTSGPGERDCWGGKKQKQTFAPSTDIQEEDIASKTSVESTIPLASRPPVSMTLNESIAHIEDHATGGGDPDFGAISFHDFAAVSNAQRSEKNVDPFVPPYKYIVFPARQAACPKRGAGHGCPGAGEISPQTRFIVW